MWGIVWISYTLEPLSETHQSHMKNQYVGGSLHRVTSLDVIVNTLDQSSVLRVAIWGRQEI